MTSKEALKLAIRCSFFAQDNDELQEIYEAREKLEKDLEVLEIIKKKNVNIRALKSWNKTYKGKLTYQKYLDILEDCDLGEKLTQKEYDLLKEVLL